MHLINSNIKWIMIVSGVITCSMLLNTVSPELALQQGFGASTFAGGADSQVANIVVRGWGFLIFLVGAMLIYAADRPVLREFVITVATISKIAFIVLVMVFGSAFLDKAMVAIVFDTIVVGLFVIYLLSHDHHVTDSETVDA